MNCNTWIETTIGEQATLQRGIDITKVNQRPGSIPVISSSGISSFHDTAAARGPGVLLGRKGVVGSVYYTEGDYWPHDTSLWVKDFHGNQPRFVYYFFKSIAGQIARMDVGSANPTLNRNHVHPIKIGWPCLRTQIAIADVLGSLDDKIEIKSELNSTLEAMARAIFHSWFVDFDPVHRNAENVTPHSEDLLFPDSFDASEMGPVPKGWLKTCLGQEIDFSTGFAFKSASFSSPGDIRLARGDNVKEGFFHWDSKTRYWPEVTNELERYRLKHGDVLIGMDGSKVGKNWVRVRTCDLPCLLVQRVACLRSLNSIGQHFIWLTVSDPKFRAYVDAVKTGTTIPHISGGQIKAYDFARPPLGDNRIFETFEQIVGPLGEQIDANIQQIRTLEALRDTLLPKLLNGEIDIKKINI